MEKTILSFVMMLTWSFLFFPGNQVLFAQPTHSESLWMKQDLSSEGGGSLEFSLPYGYTAFIPGVTAKLSLPLVIHPWQNPRILDVAVGLKLYWSNRLQIYGGNLSFGGPISLFTTATPSLTVNPLAAFSFPAGTVTVGLPGSGGGSDVYGGAVVASLGDGFAKDRISLWATGSQQKRFFCGMAVPFNVGDVQLHFSSAVGIWFLEEKLSDLDDSWYENFLPYHGIWLGGLALEGRLTWNWLKLYGGAVVAEQPWGGFSYWGRLRFAVEVPLEKFTLKVLGGFSGGLPDSITASGSKLRESFQSYINPQFTWDLREKVTGLKLRFGLGFGVHLKNTDELQPQLFSDGKLRGGVEVMVPRWRLQLVGEWLGIRLTNQSLKARLRSEEKYGGMARLTLNKVIPLFTLELEGTGHYEKGSSLDKDTIVVASGLELHPQRSRNTSLFSLVPEFSASTEISFYRMNGFDSAATEAKVSWNIDFASVKLGVWVALELKHTTQ